MAKMTMANSTSNPICSNGAIALMIDLSTTCKPGGVRIKVKHKRQQPFSTDSGKAVRSHLHIVSSKWASKTRYSSSAVLAIDCV